MNLTRPDHNNWRTKRHQLRSLTTRRLGVGWKCTSAAVWSRRDLQCVYGLSPFIFALARSSREACLIAKGESYGLASGRKPRLSSRADAKNCLNMERSGIALATYGWPELGHCPTWTTNAKNCLKKERQGDFRMSNKSYQKLWSHSIQTMESNEWVQGRVDKSD
jgi:hypothetical protein